LTSKPTVMRTTPVHCTTGRLIEAGLRQQQGHGRIIVHHAGLRVIIQPRQVVPWRFSSFVPPTVCTHVTASAGTLDFEIVGLVHRAVVSEPGAL
jgi:hypothetical protein